MTTKSLYLVKVEFSYLTLADSEQEARHFEEDAISDMSGYKAVVVVAATDEGELVVKEPPDQPVYLHGPRSTSVADALRTHVLSRKQASLPGIG